MCRRVQACVERVQASAGMCRAVQASVQRVQPSAGKRRAWSVDGGITQKFGPYNE